MLQNLQFCLVKSYVCLFFTYSKIEQRKGNYFLLMTNKYLSVKYILGRITES